MAAMVDEVEVVDEAAVAVEAEGAALEGEGLERAAEEAGCEAVEAGWAAVEAALGWAAESRTFLSSQKHLLRR